MFARWKAAILLVGALAGLALTGCGANPYGYGAGYDQYGNAYGSSYGGSYDSSYGSSYSSYDSSYGSDYSSSYGSSYDSSYGSSYGTDYSSSYGSSYGSDYGSSYGSGYPTTTGSPTPSPTKSTAPVPPTDELPALSAWVEDVKETGALGMGKIIAKVVVENPSGRTLSGRLEVRFTDNGDPTANKQTQRITLKPQEKQVLTFTADAWRLDDAEAIVTTDQDTSVTDGTTIKDDDSVVVDQP